MTNDGDSRDRASGPARLLDAVSTTAERLLGGASEGIDDPELARFATERVPGNLIQDMIGHPKASPSRAELEFMNPSVDEAELADGLDELEARGLVESVPAPDQGTQPRDATFYRLSEDGIDFLRGADLFLHDLDAIREEYATPPLPEEIEAREECPRPIDVDAQVAAIEAAARDCETNRGARPP